MRPLFSPKETPKKMPKRVQNTLQDNKPSTVNKKNISRTTLTQLHYIVISTMISILESPPKYTINPEVTALIPFLKRMKQPAPEKSSMNTQRNIKRVNGWIYIDLVKNRKLRKMSSTILEQEKPENNQKSSNTKKLFNRSSNSIFMSRINK